MRRLGWSEVLPALRLCVVTSEAVIKGSLMPATLSAFFGQADMWDGHVPLPAKLLQAHQLWTRLLWCRLGQKPCSQARPALNTKDCTLPLLLLLKAGCCAEQANARVCLLSSSAQMWLLVPLLYCCALLLLPLCWSSGNHMVKITEFPWSGHLEQYQ